MSEVVIVDMIAGVGKCIINEVNTAVNRAPVKISQISHVVSGTSTQVAAGLSTGE